MTGLESFRVELKFKRRLKRVTMRVLPGYLIRLSLPYGVKREEVERWVLSKADWILKKHDLLEAHESAPVVKFGKDAKVPFAGGFITLRISDLVKTPELNGSDLLLPFKCFKTESALRNAVVKWYQTQALIAIKTAVANYAQLLNVKPSSVRIKNYKSRWGACSSKGDLIFNWQIILFKKELFNYVIAHEICHLIEMNHSARFYSLLSELGFNKSEMHSQFKHLKNLI